MKYWKRLKQEYSHILLLSIFLFLFSIFNYIFLYFQKLYEPVAFHAYYEVARPYYGIKSKVRVESYFDQGLYNLYTSIYEVSPEKDSYSIDIVDKGFMTIKTRKLYSYNRIEKDIPYREEGKFIDKNKLPITYGMFQSKNRLPDKNITYIIYNGNNHLTAISYRNGGQIISFYRY